MSTTPTNPAILTVSGAPDGIVRLFVPNGITVSKGELRTAAARVAKTIDVGRTPAGKPGHVTVKGTKVDGHVFDFAPVKREGKGTAPASAPATEAPAEDPRVAVLRTLGLSDEQIAAALAVSGPAKADANGKGKGTAKAAPSFIVERAQRREAQAATCDKCLGYGRIRTTPHLTNRKGHAVKYPYAFRTANGAANAPTAVPCDKCGGQSATA